MKGRYSGRHMTIYTTTIPGAASIASWSYKVESLTIKAKHRLKIIDWHRSHGNNISLTSRHFGLTRHTTRQWLKRFNQYGVVGLNDLSRKPINLRKPTTSSNIIHLKEFYEQGNICCSAESMKKKLAEWQHTWNNIRPHQALNYLTPNEYLDKYNKGRLPTKDTIILQS
ncbi:MAG: helix-turn-helix domain-containing protein [Candidatus Portnoybacteria bacterium]|nr:helix-turn-helix domain-containing protein [Candidatus Portnoybacteria bacterium]